MNDKEPTIRRLHGRAIERAYQTGQDVSVCTHHGEESFYVPKPTKEEELHTAHMDDRFWTRFAGVLQAQVIMEFGEKGNEVIKAAEEKTVEYLKGE